MPTEISAVPSPSTAPKIAARPIRVAVVGCGAVTKANLMPVLAGHEGLVVTTLVDRSEARARELASAYGVPNVLTDMDALSPKDIDAVVLATPPAHHAPATIALAAKGLHVFVEKPMATNLADAEAMVTAADRAGIALSVGLYRRMLPAVRLLRTLVESQEFGAPVSIDIEEGGTYGWQLATLDLLTRAGGGGGVLIDIGSHVIDLILYMVPGPATLAGYSDNARGGIETDCVAQFSILHAGQRVPVRLELSRTRELRGSIRIKCEYATLELNRGNFTQVTVHRPSSPQSSPTTITAEWTSQPPFIGYDAFRGEVDDWITAATSGVTPELSARSVLPVVKLIEECYAHPMPLSEPWTDEGFVADAETSGSAAPRKRRVLVTGAGGFLGGRAVELLAGRYGWDVVALVREPKGAARLARWPYQIVLGDICSAADMDRALAGCDAVVHCAVGTSWIPSEVRKVTVEGTRTVAEAALRAGVKRFVHISTMNVHGDRGRSVLDETAPLTPPAEDSYGHNKLLAENVVRQVAGRGLKTIILRPARIYGPFSKTFTVRPLQALLANRFAIAGDADIPANMVYVDNVVDAMARALDAPDNLAGEAYLINEPNQLTLGGFFGFFATLTGATIKSQAAQRADSRPKPGLVSRWVSGSRAVVLSPELRSMVHRVMDTDPIGTFPRWLWNRSPEMQSKLLRLFHVDSAVVYRPAPRQSDPDLTYYGDPGLVSSAKAARDLGFNPPIDRGRAMDLTLAWARDARLVPALVLPRGVHPGELELDHADRR